MIKRPADHEELKSAKKKDEKPQKTKDDGTAPKSAANKGPLADTNKKGPEAQNECSEKPWLS